MGLSPPAIPEDVVALLAAAAAAAHAPLVAFPLPFRHRPRRGCHSPRSGLPPEE